MSQKMKEIIRIYDEDGIINVDWDFDNLQNISQILMELELLKFR